MTDQQILAGPGEITEDSKRLGLNFYAYLDGTLQTVFSSPDMGQGPGAVAWLTGNFTGPAGVAQIAQLWDNNGNLGLIGYGIVGATPQTVFESPDLGQGSGALAFLAGDFTGSGHTQIAQVWEDNGNLGLIVYGYANGTFQTVYSNVIGFKPDALAFLTGDFLGFGNTQIAQLRDDNGTLELLIYGSTEGTPQLYTDLDMDQGPAALAFLTGNFTGSGHTEIAQLWNNNGNLGLIIYGTVNGTPQTVDSDTDLFEGSGALAFLAGDFTRSGYTQIAQPWDNNGNLGLIVYGNDGLSVVAVSSSPDLGQGSGALAWLAGTFVGPAGPAVIAQPWDN